MGRKSVNYKLKQVDTDVGSNKVPEVIDSINNWTFQYLRSSIAKSEVIDHNLESGLELEEVLRSLLIKFLPKKYGVGKGKIVNSLGEKSKHLDVIIFDQINCPSLFVDENYNQVLPIESVYAVIEVKKKLDSQKLKDAFNNLYSVYKINICPSNCSCKNDMVVVIPPKLLVFSYEDNRSLETILKNYIGLVNKFSVNYSFSRFCEESPLYTESAKKNCLVDEVVIVSKGIVYDMLDGDYAIGRLGRNTFGIFLASLINSLFSVQLKDFYINNYFSLFSLGTREIYTLIDKSDKTK